MLIKELENEYGRLTAEIKKLEQQRKEIVKLLYKEKEKLYIPEKDCSHQYQSLDLRDENHITFICDRCGRKRYNSFL